MHSPKLSIIFPVYNEEHNLEPLLKELERTMAQSSYSHEIICVDDGSQDSSLRILQKMQQTRDNLQVLRHTRNYGQSAAFASGFQVARSPVIITMDADLQHDPADIPRLLQALTPDTAMVCGVRANRRDTWIKRFSSQAANAFRNRVVGGRITDAGCTFRAIRREALREIPVFNGIHRFLPSILCMQGLQVKEMAVNHRPRVSGVSKYGIGNRLWRGLLDCAAMRWYAKRTLPAKRWTEVCAKDESSHD